MPGSPRAWAVTTAAGAAVALSACVAGDGWSSDEVARIAAPGGRLDAVLVEENGGATTSFGYRVFVLPRGRLVALTSDSAVASLYGATRNDHAYGATLRWSGPGTLAVEFATAQRDTVLRPVVRVIGEEVYVTLRPGVPDSAAPAGGMLHNRQHPAL